jgi:hypothetical protein
VIFGGRLGFGTAIWTAAGISSVRSFTAPQTRRHQADDDAREQLRTAHGLFDEIGMEAFAERAWKELAATGETARKRTASAADKASRELTSQEMQVARLARDGLANPKIGARTLTDANWPSDWRRSGHVPALPGRLMEVR